MDTNQTAMWKSRWALLAVAMVLLSCMSCGQETNGHVRGIVQLENQTNHEGVQIEIPGTQFRAITNQSGQFQIVGIPQGEYEAVFFTEDYQPFRKTFSILPSKTTPLGQIVLSEIEYPEGSLAGIIKFEGKNVHENILVSLIGTPIHTKTNQDGFYSLDHVPPGTYQLLALHDGWLPATSNSIEVNDKKNTEVPEITLISLSKLPSASEKPSISGNHVLRGVAFLEGETDHDGILVSLEEYPEFVTTTDENGVFELQGLNGQEQTLLFRHAGYNDESIPGAIPVDASSTKTVGFITLRKTMPTSAGQGIIQGHVYLADRQDYANTLVRLVGISQNVVTDESGRYMFIGIPAGTYAMIAEHPGYATGTLDEVRIFPDQISPIPDITLVPLEDNQENAKGIIRGSALLQGEMDHGGITVAIDGTEFIAITGLDGAFMFSEVPVGAYTLLYTKGGFKNEYVSGIGVENGQTTALEPVVLLPDIEPPYVVETFPRDGSRRVPIDHFIDVIVRFSERMLGESVKRSVFIQPQVDFEAFFDRESEFSNMDVLHLRLHHAGQMPLMFNTRYAITLSPDAITPKGFPLAEPYTFSFTTDGPLILRSIPEDGNNQVFLDIDQPLMIETNSPVDPNSVERAIRIRPKPDSVPQYQFVRAGSGSHILINTLLRPNMRYRVQIDSSLKSMDGKRFSNTPFSISFRTGGPDDRGRYRAPGTLRGRR